MNETQNHFSRYCTGIVSSPISLWLEDRHYNDAHVAEACATPLQLASVVYSWRITMVCEPQTMG
ncbi:MAG: hypothetical protein KI791_03995 [Cyclobacteriaceae bacterium]|nr:hypothetical protein [Cyclobacteriaceae bacterium SS2]